MGRPGEEETPQFQAEYGFQYDEYHQQEQHQQQFPPPQQFQQMPQKPTPFPPAAPVTNFPTSYPGPSNPGYRPPPPAPAPMPGPVPSPPVQPYPIPRPNSEGWKAGFFSCMDDPMNALIAFFFPCITFGQIAEIIDNGQTSCGTGGLLYMLVAILTGFPCIYTCSYRTKLRSRYGLVESPAPDWITHLFCEPCALCQEYRELQLRGLDPSVGWLGNVAMQQSQQQKPQVAGMAHPTNQRMTAA